MVEGTSTVSVGRSSSIAASVASAAKRGWIVTVAPAWRAGMVWMLSPPTWKKGSAESTWSFAVNACMSCAITPLNRIAFWLSTAPFGRPVVPDV
jgi:hypothetical protein